MGRYATVKDVLNRAAIELGFDESSDPLNDTNKAFRQLQALLNSSAEDLIWAHPWTELQKEHSITTDSADSGTYTLPSDFLYMIDQTGWERTNDNALLGPLNAQDWQYLKGRDLINQSVYVSFRLQQKKFKVYPDNPVPDALEIYFEYMSDKWLEEDENTPGTTYSEVQSNDNVVLIPRSLITKYLKVKWLEAKGFDSSKQREEFAVNWFSIVGHDGGNQILNVGGRRGYPYLDLYRNTPDTNFGA